MGDDEKKAQREINFLQDDGSVDLRALVTGIMQKLLGKGLDYARMSSMDDRGFKQFERSLKDDHYQILGFGLKILEEAGHLKPGDHPHS